MNKQYTLKFLAGLIAVSVMQAAAFSRADQQTSLDEEEVTLRQYTFSWMFTESGTMKPRGGTTKGPEVQLDRRTSEAFSNLQAPNLDAKERDRRAILAMAGDYRTSFDFIETVGFIESYQPRAPYQSWGTERVYVVVNEPDFVSLQHIIVMHFLDEDGFESDAMVVKHWRQDWRYEDAEMHAFQGHGAFARVALDQASREGAWTQTVYQVDDSPRYEAVGRWFHSPGMSYWQSDDRRRPLPRREFSVRDDYQALYGSHRITIIPAGWTQEEDALKLVLDESNRPSSSQPYLAREAGLSRYDRVLDYDFSAGDEYWQETGAFWSRVRHYWSALYKSEAEFSFVKSVEGVPMFVALFGMAGERFESLADMDEAIAALLASYVTITPLAAG
ncbi:MAG: hypothetical protein CME55_07195 [Halieaceae bacterium]|nr:hypothetical protein [Halieaceae bacterium]